MDFRVVLVITPIVFSWIFTVFWLGKWDVFRLTPFGLPKEGVVPVSYTHLKLPTNREV